MSTSYETRAAIASLPGKTVRPWKSGDEPCHCTHCDLCGVLFRTIDIGAHIDECQKALIAALALNGKRLAITSRDVITANNFIAAAVRSGVGTLTERNIMAQFVEQKFVPLMIGSAVYLEVVPTQEPTARHVGGKGNQLAQQLAVALDDSQVAALLALSKNRRSWSGTTWNGMYNGLAGHGLCAVRRLPGGTATTPRYTARITKLGLAVLKERR